MVLALCLPVTASPDAPQRGRYSAEEAFELQVSDRPDAGSQEPEMREPPAMPTPTTPPRPHPPMPPRDVR